MHGGVGIILPLLILVVWWLAQRGNNFSLPSISSVFSLLWHLGATPQISELPPLSESLIVSFVRTVSGFIIATALAVPLGLLVGRSRRLSLFVDPTADFIYAVSPIAWLPVMISFIGVDSLADLVFGRFDAWSHAVIDNILPAMLLIIAMAAFFPIFYTTKRAAASVREDLVEMAVLAGAKRYRILRRIIFPYCLPEIIGGMRIGLGRSWMVIVAAEMYPGTRSGLGYTIWVSHSTLDYSYTFAAIILIGILGVIMNKILLLLELKYGHWEARRV